MNWNGVIEIATREIRASFRNRWFFVMAGIILLVNLAVIYYGVVLSGKEASPDLNALLLSVIHAQMYLVPILALILSYGAILVEREQGTLDLLLSYPLRYREIVMGKWIGFSLVLGAGLVVGLSGPFALYLTHGGGVQEVVVLLILSFALGIVFNSIGLFLSSIARDRTFAISAAVLIWALFIFLFDLALVVLLVLSKGAVSDTMIQSLMLLNPAEIFRVLSIMALLDPAAIDLFGLGQGLLVIPVVVTALCAWLVLPLIPAGRNFFER